MTLSSHTQPLDDGTTVTGTIVFGGACAVDDTIVITDAAGTSKTFTAKGSTTAGSLQFINTDAAAAATALKLCIDNAAGFGTNSITVADNSSGTLTLTLASPGTYRFKDKAEINPADDITNVTVTDFGSGGGAEDIDGHTIVGGGTVGGFNSKGNTKSNLDTVKGVKSSGSKLYAQGATIAGITRASASAHVPGVALARSGGTLAYNPQSKSVTLSTSNIGWLMRGGTATLLSGIAATGNVLAIPGSHERGRGLAQRNLYHRKGLWSDTLLDLFNGKVYAADGAAKSTITGRGTTVTLALDDENRNDRTPGEFVILSNFVDYTTDSSSGGTAASTNLKNYSDITG